MALAGQVGPLTVVHLLEGILAPPPPPPSSPEDGASGGAGVTIDEQVAQAVSSARRLADQRAEAPALEHLLVVLIDEGDPGALACIRGLGMDPADVRRDALLALGPSPDGVWEELRHRQERLPLRRIHRRSDWYAVCRNEHRAVMRLTARHSIDGERRRSLARHHLEEVERRVRAAAADALPPVPTGLGRPMLVRVQRRHWRIPPRLRQATNVFVGWPVWFGNRWVGVRALYLRLIRAS